MAIEFKLPELAENIDSATVTKVLVSVGDVIAVDQPVVEVETDKAAAEVPSSIAGKVVEIRAKEGEVLRVGQVVLVIEAAGTPEQTPPPKPGKPATVQPKPAPKPGKPATVQPKPASGGEAVASPLVRRLARELGVDIRAVPGTGPGGHITQEDVKAYARQMNAEAASAAARPATAAGPPRDFSRFGPVERVPMSGVRRRTAENMVLAWTTIPQVTHFDKADITELEKSRKQYGKRVEAAGGKVTVTAVLVKIVAEALKKFPQFNASVDFEQSEVLLKKFYNIGVAVDTDRGLIVPVVRDADAKGIAQIAVELGQLAERARTRKSSLDELDGGTFTISNLGGIGGTGFNPIIYPPEVAILGVSRARVEPVFVDGQFQPRTMLPLALTYDHRVIDGADAARFLRWVCEALEQPLALTLEG